MISELHLERSESKEKATEASSCQLYFKYMYLFVHNMAYESEQMLWYVLYSLCFSDMWQISLKKTDDFVIDYMVKSVLCQM